MICFITVSHRHGRRLKMAAPPSLIICGILESFLEPLQGHWYWLIFLTSLHGSYLLYTHRLLYKFSFSRDSSCSYSVVMPGFDWLEHWIKRLEMCRLEAICSLYRHVNSIYPFIQVACFPIPLLLSLSCMPMPNGFLAVTNEPQHV